MSKKEFKNLIKSRIITNASEYLKNTCGSKGTEIEYTIIEMSDYLSPFDTKQNIEEKRKMFEIRNRMTRIGNNYGKKEEKCICGAIETMAHIYLCKSLNQNNQEISYDQIYNGNLNSQIEVFKRFQKNLEIRKEIKENDNPCDPRDPLSCDQYRFG